MLQNGNILYTWVSPKLVPNFPDQYANFICKYTKTSSGVTTETIYTLTSGLLISEFSVAEMTKGT